MREDQAFAMDQAIEHGDEAALSELLTREPRLTGTPVPVNLSWGEEMWLGLHRSACKGHLVLMNLFLDHGASIDARTRFRTPMHGRATALMIAAQGGYEPLVAELIKRGCGVDLLDANHRSALSFAATGGERLVVQRLIDGGCLLDPVDDQGRTPLHAAIAAGHADVALLLIEAGADVDHCCPKEPAGFTSLHRCVAAGSAMEVVADRLKQVGADTTLRDPRFEKTAADLALG